MGQSTTVVGLGTIDLRDYCACPGPPCPECCDVCCPLDPPALTLYADMLNQTCAGLVTLTADQDVLTWDAVNEWWYGESTYYINGTDAGTYGLRFTCSEETASMTLFIISGSLPAGEYIGSELVFQCTPFFGQWSWTVSLCSFDFTLSE